MTDRAFHPCKYCGNPVSIPDWNAGIIACGHCPLRRADANDIVIADKMGVKLPTCSYCSNELRPRNDGHVSSICYECANSRMIRCMVPGHKGKQETREIQIRTVAYYVANFRSKDHGKTLKMNGCVQCISVKRLETWDEYVRRTSKQYDENGVLIEPSGQSTLVLTSPYSNVGGIRNRWKPPVGINGVGQWIAFDPIGFKPVIDAGVERWVLHVSRLTQWSIESVPETTEGSIVHQGINQWIRDITRPLVSTSEHVARGSGGILQKTLPNERREVMRVSEVGWCFAGIKSVDKDDKRKHMLFLSRYAEHTMHYQHTKHQWFDHCMREFVP